VQKRGGRSLDQQTLTVGAATTVTEFLTFMDDSMGIQTGGSLPGTPGLSMVTGQIKVLGNYGTANDIDLSVGDFTVSGTAIPIAFTKNQSADGESALTDYVVFDSLGQQVKVKMTAVLESRDSVSSSFRWFMESFDDSDQDIAMANGLLVFDSKGTVTSGGTATFSIDRGNTAAVSPMQLTADLSTVSGISSAASGSTLSLASQDGSDPGTLTGFVIDETGVINGVFDNGIIRTLGQITLSRFSNPQGLLESGSGTYREGVSSGSPFITTPGNFGAGSIRTGSIELSNTDIGRNLVELIVASTNYRGNARVISSIQQLVDELLVLGR